MKIFRSRAFWTGAILGTLYISFLIYKIHQVYIPEDTNMVVDPYIYLLFDLPFAIIPLALVKSLDAFLETVLYPADPLSTFNQRAMVLDITLLIFHFFVIGFLFYGFNNIWKKFKERKAHRK